MCPRAAPERERFSDPDASWGHRSAISTRKGGGFYGYKLNAAVCTRTEVETARTHEASLADTLLAQVRERVAAQTATLDQGYDTQPVHNACHANGMLPVIPLKATHAVSVARTGHPSASTASGRSPEPTSNGTRRSGAARLASASPQACGARRLDCNHSSLARASGSATSTEAGAQSSGVSAA
jgi:hypothetical protein